MNGTNTANPQIFYKEYDLVSAHSVNDLNDLVGVKTSGLLLIPRPWRLPLAVVPTLVYDAWGSQPEGTKRALLRDIVSHIMLQGQAWYSEWPTGLILRSSTTTETLRDRGRHHSPKLPKDYDEATVATALEGLLDSALTDGSSRLAILVQPLISSGRFGHFSNERRVSKTINHWEWEQTAPDLNKGRVNSQRHSPSSPERPLAVRDSGSFLEAIKGLGAWSVLLKRGRSHFEWSCSRDRFFVVQLDFEDESPDSGVDPRNWQRESDHSALDVPTGETLIQVVVHGVEPSIWRKVENTRIFAEERSDPFPNLFTVTGDQLLAHTTNAPARLKEEIYKFARDRVVCRTDSTSSVLPRQNLPRTNTISSTQCVNEMYRILQELQDDGADPDEICFILHRFIPARVGAWARAYPNEQIVRVDSLWGVPDGLQYLPHDTFEYDVKNQTLTAERIRYKPRFVQEVSDGSWQELRISRKLARHRSLSLSDIREIANISHKIATKKGSPLLIMWFCCIPEHLNIGRNLPWFSMNANPPSLLHDAPQDHLRHIPRVSVRSTSDLDRVEQMGIRRHILVLEPEVDLIRDDKRFLNRVMALAKAQDLTVELAGSILSHAYFELERSGVSVVLADEAGHSRTRRRMDFRKLVRDQIPSRIQHKGEAVVSGQLPKAELRRALVAKLLEESQELLSAREYDAVREELADLLEVVRGLASATGVEWSQVELSALEKNQERGGFETGAVLMETSLPTPDKPARRSLAATSLESLGKVEIAADRTNISFNALIAAGPRGTEISVPGDKVVVVLTANGIEIRPVSKPGQLPLPLFESDS